MTFEPGTGSVPPSTPASGSERATPVAEPVSATVGPVEAAPRVAPPQPQKPVRPGGRASTGTLLLAVGLMVAVGGVAFAVGRVTAPASTAGAGARAFGGNGYFNGNAAPNGSFAPGLSGARDVGGLGAAFGGLTGTVTAISADSLTIQVGGANGRTLQVPLSSSTTYHTEVPAAATDVTVGAEVTVRTSRAAATGGQGSGTQGGQAPQSSGAPGGDGAAPGAGGPPSFTIGPATDVTVISKSGQ